MLSGTTIVRMRKKTRIYRDTKTSSTTEKEVAVARTEAVLDSEMATSRHRTMEDMLSNQGGTLELRRELGLCNPTWLPQNLHGSLDHSPPCPAEHKHLCFPRMLCLQSEQHNSSGHFPLNDGRDVLSFPHPPHYFMLRKTYTMRAFAVYVASSRHPIQANVSQHRRRVSVSCFHASNEWLQNAST